MRVSELAASFVAVAPVITNWPNDASGYVSFRSQHPMTVPFSSRISVNQVPTMPTGAIGKTNAYDPTLRGVVVASSTGAYRIATDGGHTERVRHCRFCRQRRSSNPDGIVDFESGLANLSPRRSP